MNGDHETRSPAQRQRILALLQERGADGITNSELNRVCFRYGARIRELRRAGHNIRTDNLGDGLFRFVLGSPEANPNSWTNSEPADGDHEQDLAVPHGDVGPASLTDYDRRTRELRGKAMPLFAGVRS
jgi:hypothetical protein